MMAMRRVNTGESSLQAFVKGRRGSPGFASRTPIAPIATAVHQAFLVAPTAWLLKSLNAVREVLEVLVGFLEFFADVLVFSAVDCDVDSFSQSSYRLAQ